MAQRHSCSRHFADGLLCGSLGLGSKGGSIITGSSTGNVGGILRGMRGKRRRMRRLRFCWSHWGRWWWSGWTEGRWWSTSRSLALTVSGFGAGITGLDAVISSINYRGIGNNRGLRGALIFLLKINQRKKHKSYKHSSITDFILRCQFSNCLITNQPDSSLISKRHTQNGESKLTNPQIVGPKSREYFAGHVRRKDEAIGEKAQQMRVRMRNN